MQDWAGSWHQSCLPTSSERRASAEALSACFVWSEPMARRRCGWRDGLANACTALPVCVSLTQAGKTVPRDPTIPIATAV
jgi:hypothetical protein